MSWIVTRLARTHERGHFRCGEPALDDYLRRYAGQDAKKGFASVFVATRKDDPAVVAGFYTLSAASVLLERLPPASARTWPRYPEVLCILLGRLAVALPHQGRHLGSYLLLDALTRVLNNELAWALFLVQAKAEQSRRFYARFGFSSFADNTMYVWMTRQQAARVIDYPAEQRA